MLLERIDTGLLLPLAAAAEEKQTARLISNVQIQMVEQR